MLEEPTATGVIVSVEPDTLTVTKLVCEEDAVKLRTSLSGSLKLLDKSTVCALPPSVSVAAEIDPVGGLLPIEARNDTVVLVVPSLAVTDISAAPLATGVIVSVESDTLTVAYDVLEELAVKLSVSPSASLKLLDKSTVCAPPATVSVTVEIEPVGALLTGGLTVAVKCGGTQPTSPSSAVIEMVEVPSATGVRVSVEPDTLAVTYFVFEDPAEKVSESPSGSLKLLDKSMVCAPPPTVSVTLESEPCGRLLFTVAVKDTAKAISPSSAATCILDVPPLATGVSVSVEPDTLAVTWL